MLHTAALRIVGEKENKEGIFRNLRMLYLLSGTARVTNGNSAWTLREGEYLAINPLDYSTVQFMDDGLLGIMEFNQDAVRSCFDLQKVQITCFSRQDSEKIRRRISALLRRCFGYYEKRGGPEGMLIEAAVWELLYILRENCVSEKKASIIEKKRDDASVRSQILGYLHQHYAEPVTLSDLAGLTWFSEAYLSRYIRRQFGQNFGTLLMDIRLNHAVEQVKGSREKLIRIALENGFPNAAAFNREFRRRYGATPSDYRKMFREKSSFENGADAEETESADDELERKIHEYLRKSAVSLEDSPEDEQVLAAADGNTKLLRRFWSKIINAGFARDLLRADMQEHLSELHKAIGFRYVRFWDIWSPELTLYDGNPEHNYSFSRLDAAIAYLYNHQMVPYIDIGFKPVQLMDQVSRSLVYEERRTPFHSMPEFHAFLESFLRHYIRLYGEEYVGEWCLEIWLDPRVQNVDDYLDLFEDIYRRVKMVLPEIRIGGAGFSREYGDHFEETIRKWSGRFSQPDFVSVYLYPFDNGFLDPVQEGFEDGNPGKITPLRGDGEPGKMTVYRGDDYVLRFMEKTDRILKESGIRAELHLSEWNSTFVNRDPLNDGLYKGAYIVRSLMQMIGKVDAAGYWFGSDLFSGFYDSDHLLDGSGGLLSKDGICKPAFYGFEFFNRLGSFFLASDENSIITSEGRGRYRIVCHNYVHPGDAYFDAVEKQERYTPSEEEGELFSGSERRFRYVISGVPNGTYTVKTRILDREHGSVEDEWNRMGRTDALDRRDVEYLRRISVPQISVQSLEVSSRMMELQITLPPNGIGNIHVFSAG